jgi:hypothetical protein
MKKFTVLLLAALFMVAGTAYLISKTGSDKAEQAQLREHILALKKAELGSTDKSQSDRIIRGREQDRARFVTEQEGECPACSETVIVDIVGGGEIDEYSLCCCAGQFVKLDVSSEKIGSPTDVYISLQDMDDVELMCADDGRDLGGASTDACLLFVCPADGQYKVLVENLAAPDIADTDVDAYVLTASVLCDGEVEPNELDTPGNLNCSGDVVVDEDADMPDEGSDEGADGPGGRVQGTFVDGDVGCWTVCLNEGDIFQALVDSGTCDNTCDGDVVDPIMTVYDATTLDPINGPPPSSGDDDTFVMDPAVAIQAPATGMYIVCIEERPPLGNGGVYDISWTILTVSDTADINCAEDGVIIDEDADEEGDL